MMPFYTFITKAELHSFNLSSTQNLKPAEILEGVRVPMILQSPMGSNPTLFQDCYRLQQIVLSFKLNEEALEHGAIFESYDKNL